MIKTLVLSLLLAAGVGVGVAASKKPAKSVEPSWLQSRIKNLEEKYKDTDRSISISKYSFNGKTYYLMPPAAPCCDMPTELVDESGNSYCQLGGGFANHTDKQCANFQEVGKLIETVWTKKK